MDYNDEDIVASVVYRNGSDDHYELWSYLFFIDGRAVAWKDYDINSRWEFIWKRASDGKLAWKMNPEDNTWSYCKDEPFVTVAAMADDFIDELILKSD